MQMKTGGRKPEIRYKDVPVDNSLILGTIAKLIYDNHASFSEDENLILHAIKRSNFSFADLSPEEIGEVLSGYDEDQLLGFSNNVKGILHELQYVEIVNTDDSHYTASLFPDTNHEGFDIMMTDHETGEIVKIQLKATDSTSYVNAWIDEYPDGEILVTQEIAEKMDLETTGISNDELTVSVNDFVDKLVESSDTDDFWDYMPYLPAISIAIAGSALFFRYRKGDMDFTTFRTKFLKLTGLKIVKFSIILTLLMIPGVNIVTGAGILFMTMVKSNELLRKVKVKNTQKRG